MAIVTAFLGGNAIAMDHSKQAPNLNALAVLFLLPATGCRAQTTASSGPTLDPAGLPGLSSNCHSPLPSPGRRSPPNRDGPYTTSRPSVASRCSARRPARPSASGWIVRRSGAREPKAMVNAWRAAMAQPLSMVRSGTELRPSSTTTIATTGRWRPRLADASALWSFRRLWRATIAAASDSRPRRFWVVWPIDDSVSLVAAELAGCL